MDESLYGLVRVHSGLTLLADHRVVVRSDIDVEVGRVSILNYIIVAILLSWHYLTYCGQWRVCMCVGSFKINF